ncbi:DDB1- and CUL4-associated factor 8 [Acipenser ruthenus]|uniref:DDB1-and CUL4-associated factor 8 n=1 Tax=Acipenser ruthenus TaxID=7906 RepID=A0A444V214_ACIRT|nr:DDB1- and CUL4-associated factor 8 [Acipenser ruthenus]
MSRRQGELDQLVAAGYRSALTEERRRYCFLVDRQCAVTKHFNMYHSKVRELLSQKLSCWQASCSQPTRLPERALNLVRQTAAGSGNAGIAEVLRTAKLGNTAALELGGSHSVTHNPPLSRPQSPPLSHNPPVSRSHTPLDSQILVEERERFPPSHEPPLTQHLPPPVSHNPPLLKANDIYATSTLPLPRKQGIEARLHFLGGTLPRVSPSHPSQVLALFPHSPQGGGLTEAVGGASLLHFLPGDTVALLISEPRDGWHYGENERTGRVCFGKDKMADKDGKAGLGNGGSGETAQDKTAEQEGERREEEEEEEEEEQEQEQEQESDSMEETVRYSLTEEAGDSDDRSGGGGGSRRELRKRRRNRSRGHTSSSSDEDIEEEDEEEEEEEEDEQALDEWLDSELKELGCPGWRAVPELRAREIGRGLPHFTPRACGARGLVQRFKLQGSLEKHSGCVNTLHFNSSGSRLASGSDDLKVIIWDWTRKRAVLEFETGHKSNVFQAKFLPHSGDSTLVMCARDGQIRLADLSATQRCKSTKKVAQHKGAAHKVEPGSARERSFSDPSRTHTQSHPGEDAVVYGIDLRLDRPATKLVVTKENDKKVGLYTIYVNPARTDEFAVGGRDQYVRIYDQRKINENENNGVLKKFCPQHLVTSESKTNITLKGVNFYGPRDEFVVSGSDCGHIYLWEKNSARIVQFMEGDKGGVVSGFQGLFLFQFLF